MCEPLHSIINIIIVIMVIIMIILSIIALYIGIRQLIFMVKQNKKKDRDMNRKWWMD